MGDAVGCAEFLLERLAEADALQEAAGHAIAHVDFGGDNAMGFHRIPGAEGAQGAYGIGRHLQAGADFLEGTGLFEKVNWAPDGGQAEAGGQAGDAAAGDEEGVFSHRSILHQLC